MLNARRRGQDWRREWSLLWIASPLQGSRPANLYIIMGRMLPFRLALPLLSLTKMRVEHTQNGSFFGFFLFFGLHKYVFSDEPPEELESLTLSVTTTCLLSSLPARPLFLSLICPPWLPCWVLCGLTLLTWHSPGSCWSENGMNSPLASQDWQGECISWMGWGSLFATGHKQRSCHPQHLMISKAESSTQTWAGAALPMACGDTDHILPKAWLPLDSWGISGFLGSRSGFCSLWPNHFKYTKA